MLLQLKHQDLETREKQCLQDIAILTGGEVISSDLGYGIKRIQL